ncbi:MAG: hypothetical protein NT001_03750 [Candidatus Woesearchaeota archaeon]|nr:hypothetical protein [Candidatus Woesearchaeota archaeon]
MIKGFFSKDGTDDNFKEYHDVASSQHGPVSSQFRALKKRVGTYHPFVKKIKLERYIPSMIDKEGVDSTMRVYIEFSLQTKNGEERWGTVGVSDDIMQASYESLKKCIEYALIRNEKGEFQIK